jgi:hypothetical protein
MEAMLECTAEGQHFIHFLWTKGLSAKDKVNVCCLWWEVFVG